MRMPAGQTSLTYLGPFRPHDAHAALTPASDGSVLGVSGQPYRVTASVSSPATQIPTVIPGVGNFEAQWAAQAPNGEIYADQDGESGIGPAAVLAITPEGKVTVLWRAATA